MKVFISQAKDKARAFALELHFWIKANLDNMDTWCAADIECLNHGNSFPQDIVNNALSSDVCLAILTPQSVSAYWLNFEVGIFFGQQNKNVFTILCDGLHHSDLGDHPLTALGQNYSSFSLDSLTNLIFSMYKHNDSGVSLQTVKNNIAPNFKQLEEKYNTIFGKKKL
jgi:hypothetical protein